MRDGVAATAAGLISNNLYDHNAPPVPPASKFNPTLTPVPDVGLALLTAIPSTLVRWNATSSSVDVGNPSAFHSVPTPMPTDWFVVLLYVGVTLLVELLPATFVPIGLVVWVPVYVTGLVALAPDVPEPDQVAVIVMLPIADAVNAQAAWHAPPEAPIWIVPMSVKVNPALFENTHVIAPVAESADAHAMISEPATGANAAEGNAAPDVAVVHAGSKLFAIGIRAPASGVSRRCLRTR